MLFWHNWYWYWYVGNCLEKEFRLTWSEHPTILLTNMTYLLKRQLSDIIMSCRVSRFAFRSQVELAQSWDDSWSFNVFQCSNSSKITKLGLIFSYILVNSSVFLCNPNQTFWVLLIYHHRWSGLASTASGGISLGWETDFVGFCWTNLFLQELLKNGWETRFLEVLEAEVWREMVGRCGKMWGSVHYWDLT